MTKSLVKETVSLAFFLDKNGETLLSADNNLYQMLGYTFDELKQSKQPFSTLIHIDDADITKALFSLEPQETVTSINFRLRHSNGKIICLLANYQKKYHQDSDTLSLQLQLIDPKSVLVPMEDQVLTSNFAVMMDTTDDYIYFKDRNHVFTGASQTLVSLTKPSQHWRDLLGKTDYDVFLEEYADAYYRLEKQVFSGEIKVAHEVQETIDTDGNRGWVDNRKYPIEDASGNVVGLFGIARDITEHKLLEIALKQSEEHFRTIFSEAPLGIAVIDSLSGKIYDANLAYERISGRTLAELKSITWMELFHPDDVKEDLCDLAHISSDNISGLNKQKRYVQSDGTITWVSMIVAPMQGDDKGTSRYLCMVEDITEYKKTENQLKLAATVFQNTDQAITVTDKDNFIVAINPAFTELTGYSSVEVIGKNPRLLQSGRYDKSYYKKMWESLNSTGHWQGEIWNKKKSGVEYAESLRINSIYDGNGNVYRRVALFSDITDKKVADEKIWHQANFDALTQLPNRRMFRDRLAHEIKVSKRTNKPLALLFLDLDYFKQVNDTLGHAKGDQLLIEVAQRISDCVRESDTVARLSGDEFTVILPELDNVIRVERVAVDILHSLSIHFLLDSEKAFISASIGISLYPNDSDNIDQLINNADQAMYQSKENGRNQFSFFTRSMQVIARENSQLSKDLRFAIKDKQLQLFYQPIVHLQTNKISKAEAIMRWNHPVHGVLDSVDFIPLAEETGFIVEIGNWFFKQAVGQVESWQENLNPAFEIFINKSSVEFRSATNYLKWINCLHQLWAKEQSVVLELSESVLINHSVAIKSKLIELNEKGLGVAIDEFGTGYSALSNINQYNVNYIKISATLIRDLTASSSELIFCEAIIAMAHKFGVQVVAKGIETDQQKQLLINAGCDYGQGPLFCNPLTSDLVEILLAN